MNKEKYTYIEKETSLNVVQNNIESVRRKNITRTGLRIYKDGLIGVGGALGVCTDQELEKQALNGLQAKIPYPYSLSENRKEHVEISDSIISDMDIIKQSQEMLDHLRLELPDFSFSNKINRKTESYALKNNLGLDLKYSDTWVSMGLIFKEKSSANIFDGFCSYEGKKFVPEAFEKYICSVCNAFNNEVNMEFGKKYPILFFTSESLPMMQFYRDLNGLSFATKNSLLSEKKGKKVFNENITLFQNSSYEDRLTPFFDAEGVINEGYEYTLIENGIVKTPFTDKKTSQKYNLELTGSAGASYDGVPTLAGNRLCLKNGNKSLVELLDGEKGILVFMAGGGDFTPKGDFASPVQFALLTDGKNLLGRLPQIQISSQYYDMFGNDYIGVSNDGYFSYSREKYLAIKMRVDKI
ncbi:hypothetical protein KAJ27_08825 [bacterium]|nr:hypothetical protein [bacterium]